MGSPIQATMFFKQGNSGWSEVLVMNAAQFLSLADAQKEVVRSGGLGQLRTNLLGIGAEIIGIRLSKYGVWRDSNYTAKQANSPPSNIWGTPASASGNTQAVQPYDALAVRLECGDSYRRLTYLSGMPQDIYQEPDFTKWRSQYASYFTDYFQYVSGSGSFKSGRFGTIVSTKNVTDPPVANVQTGPGQAPTLAVVAGQNQITLAPNDGLTGIKQGQRVRILGVRGQPGMDMRKWNGVFTVINGQVAASFTILPKVDVDQETFAKLDWSKAYIFLPDKDFQPFTDYEVERRTHRKRGVAFGTPRGRSRTQA